MLYICVCRCLLRVNSLSLTRYDYKKSLKKNGIANPLWIFAKTTENSYKFHIFKKICHRFSFTKFIKYIYKTLHKRVFMLYTPEMRNLRLLSSKNKSFKLHLLTFSIV